MGHGSDLACKWGHGLNGSMIVDMGRFLGKIEHKKIDILNATSILVHYEFSVHSFYIFLFMLLVNRVLLILHQRPL